MKEKRYRVSKELKPFVRRVLTLNHVTHRMEKDKDGQWWCVTRISSNHFHRIVQRAKCEKATEETGVLHVTYRESLNQAFTTALLKQRKETSFAVIDDDDAKRRMELF